MRFRLIYLISLVLASLAIPRAQQPTAGVDEEALRAAIIGDVAAVSVERLDDASDRIIIDLSQTAVTAGPAALEALTTRLIESTARLTAGRRLVEYEFRAGGIAIDRLLAPPGSQAFEAQQVGTPRRVVVSAGHGWYRHEASASWRLQRDYFWGIVEDLVNWDIAHYLRNELTASSFDVRVARNPDRNGGTGVSGHPKWQESAKYHIKDLGAPASTWDVGADDYAKDINSRPFYANWVDAALIVSVHNNGGGGTGTETWFDTTNPHAAESRRLAEIVNRRVVSAIRERYRPDWPDRGLRSCNGCHGENRLATRPAVIVEIAFMDTKSPDNDALHSEAFKLFVAQAIRDAIVEFTGATSGSETFEDQVRREIVSRAAGDSRFGAMVAGSSGADLGWDSNWELRWLDFEFSGGRLARLYHATHRADRAARFTGFWDPDSGQWRGWDFAR